MQTKIKSPVWFSCVLHWQPVSEQVYPQPQALAKEKESNQSMPFKHTVSTQMFFIIN